MAGFLFDCLNHINSVKQSTVFLSGKECCPNGNSYSLALATMLYAILIARVLWHAFLSAVSHWYCSIHPALICIWSVYRASPRILAPASTAAYRLFGLFSRHGYRDAFAGRVADKSGRKPVAIFGAITFILASLLCSQAHNSTHFLIGRFIRGSAREAATSSPLPFCAIRWTSAAAPRYCRCLMALPALFPFSRRYLAI